MYGRWLACSAVAYVVLHHLGLLPGGLGAAPDDTEWADWLDLLVPFLVLAPVAAALQTGRATPATWWLFGVGSRHQCHRSRRPPRLAGAVGAIALLGDLLLVTLG